MSKGETHTYCNELVTVREKVIPPTLAQKAGEVAVVLSCLPTDYGVHSNEHKRAFRKERYRVLSFHVWSRTPDIAPNTLSGHPVLHDFSEPLRAVHERILQFKPEADPSYLRVMFVPVDSQIGLHSDLSERSVLGLLGSTATLVSATKSTEPELFDIHPGDMYSLHINAETNETAWHMVENTSNTTRIAILL